MAHIIDSETLGRIVRDTWIQWAKIQPDIADHPNWLTEWDQLAERDKEVDRLIGAAIARHISQETVRRLMDRMVDPANFPDPKDFLAAELQNSTIRSAAHALGVLDELDRLWGIDAKG